MRGVWATVLSVWALFAVVAVLAWTRQQPAATQQGQNAVVVTTKTGKRQLVVLPGASAGTTHATTRTSPVPAG